MGHCAICPGRTVGDELVSALDAAAALLRVQLC
jgi:hypothetical protein